MKITMMLLMFCVLAFTPAVFAQTINLFEDTPVTWSDSRFPANGPFVFGDAISFGTVSVFCPAGGTGTLTGDATGGGFIVDNFLTVNGTNVCPNNTGVNGQGNCFSSFDGTTQEGEDIRASFGAVGPTNISTQLATGGLFTFRLMDYGGFFGNTTLNLTNTNCTEVEQDEEGRIAVCRKNNRNKNKNKDKNMDGEFKTIFVNPEDVKEGDTLGRCRAGS